MSPTVLPVILCRRSSLSQVAQPAQHITWRRFDVVNTGKQPLGAIEFTARNLTMCGKRR